jgi:pimeloyl-ACP methyl ester carboxylesterase
MMAMKLIPPSVMKWGMLQQCSAADNAVVSRLSDRQATGFFYEALRHGPAGEIQEYRVMFAPWGFTPEQITGEVQHWHGTDDALCLPMNAQELAKRIPNATLQMVPNTGHFLLHVKAAAIFDGLTQ